MIAASEGRGREGPGSKGKTLSIAGAARPGRDASARARCQLEAAPAHVDGHGASLPVSNGPLARVTSPGEPGLLSLGTGSAARAL